MTAVLIPVHNALEEAQACLDALPMGLVTHVYDDASGPATAGWVDGLQDVYALRNESPQGYAHHLNTFALWCLTHRERCAVVLNSDTVPGPRSLSRLAEAAEEHWADWCPCDEPTGALFAGPALSYAKSGQGEDPALQAMDPALGMTSQLIELEIIRTQMTPRRLPTVNGAAFAFSPQAWLRYGPFDERFGRGSAEEEEWMRRVNRLSGGDRGLYVPSACVWHWGHASFGAVEGLDTKALWRGNRKLLNAKESGEDAPDHALMGHPREWPVYQ